jgi:hypothetical protein
MSRSRPSGRLTILDLVLLVAGTSVGLWLFLGVDRNNNDLAEKLLGCLIFLLGGLSIVGPPILIWQRRKGGRRLGPGELLWFCQGTGSWLLWPPIVIQRAQGRADGRSMATICFFYGTPMMALFVAISLLFGGWMRRRRRRRRTGHEVLGLLLGLAWACTGLYVLWVIYREDLK